MGAEFIDADCTFMISFFINSMDESCENMSSDASTDCFFIDETLKGYFFFVKSLDSLN